MDKFKDIYRIESARLQTWDYSWNGAYFITICTASMESFFGKIMNHTIQLNEIGEFAHKFWHEIPGHFPFIKQDAIVIMPNHVHGILIIDKNSSDMDVVETGHCPVFTTITTITTIKTEMQSPGQKRHRNQEKNTISSIIGSFKSVVSKHAHKINPGFAWQSRFYDHIIRDDKSFNHIRNYIINNPIKWKEDDLYYE